MYKASSYKEKSEAQVRALIQKYPLAFLSCVNQEGYPIGTQIPLILKESEGKLVLRGHMMKASDHYKAFKLNHMVLAVFTGPNAFISSSWYEDGKVPSTWNYMSVHVHGNLVFLDDSTLLAVLKETSAHFEKGSNKSNYFDEIPLATMKKLMPLIAGFEVEIDKIESVFKLSQDQNDISKQNILRELENSGGLASALSGEMKAFYQD